MFYPDPALLEQVCAGSRMATPEKVKAVCGELTFPEPPATRPYLYGCMVLSFDGKMGFADDPEGTLISKNNSYDPQGGKLDFWMMNVCRAYADAVIMGTGTLKARMNKLWYAQIHDPDLLESRRELGKQTKEPLSLIASIDGSDIPFEHAVFHMDPAPIIMTSRAGAELVKERLDREVRIVTEPEDLYQPCDALRVLASGEEKTDTDGILALLRACGIKHVSVEAPGYIWALIREKKLDEYMLNYSGVMAGGNTALGTWGPFGAQDHPEVALLSVGYTRGFLFTRQKLVY